MIKIATIDPVCDGRWDKFVMDHAEGTVFHTSAWASVIHRSYGFQPQYTVVVDDKNEILFGIPVFLLKLPMNRRRMICLPFTDECGPLLEHAAGPSVWKAVLEQMFSENRGTSIEIRSRGLELLIDSCRFVRSDYYRIFKLDLSSGIDTLWKGFKQKSIRYPIKKAQSMNLRIERTVDINDLKDFYRLNVQTRKKHGVVPQPFRFFENIHREMMSRGQAFLFAAKVGDRQIAGSIFFKDKNTVYHKYNASSQHDLHYQPNTLLLWHAIQYACQNGCKWFDFGRTSPDNKGLMQFKRHWGTQEFGLPYFYYPQIKGASGIKESSTKYRLASSLFKRTPTPVLQLLGDHLYSYLT